MTEAPAVKREQATTLGDGDSLYEVIDGKVVEKPPKSVLSALVATRMIGLLYTTDAVERLERVTCEGLFQLDAARPLMRRPEVAFVSYERWPRRRPVSGEAWDVIPDLAVQVISPSNSAVDIVEKIREYFRAGVRLVWVIYPIQRIIYVYGSRTDIRVLQPDDDLDGGPVIPGFRVGVKDVFKDQRGEGE